jgi:hypothetical protein
MREQAGPVTGDHVYPPTTCPPVYARDAYTDGARWRDRIAETDLAGDIGGRGPKEVGARRVLDALPSVRAGADESPGLRATLLDGVRRLPSDELRIPQHGLDEPVQRSEAAVIVVVHLHSCLSEEEKRSRPLRRSEVRGELQHGFLVETVEAARRSREQARVGYECSNRLFRGRADVEALARLAGNDDS